MSINVNTIKGQNINCTILKAYVYTKEFVRSDGVPYRKYLTVISEVPEKDFSSRIPIENGKHSPTYGVFVEVIGNADVIRPKGSISLSKYQKYIESLGYTFIGTAPGVKGTTLENTRQAAYQVIKRHMKGGDKEKVSTINKAGIFKYLDTLEYAQAQGQSITPHLDAIRNMISYL